MKSSCHRINTPTEVARCRVRSGNNACPGNPLDCASAECVTLLLRLAFDRSEAVDLLTQVTGDSTAGAYRIGVLYTRLSTIARSHTAGADTVNAALADRLGRSVPTLDSAAMFDIARTWAVGKETMDGRSGAALLWSVARSPLPCIRKLEAMLVEDLQYLAARSLSHNGPATSGAGASMSPGSVVR